MSDMTINRFTADGVDDKTLPELVGQGTWRWAYVEQPSSTELTWFATLAAKNQPWASWHHGRLFDEDTELAWWLEYNGRFTCRLLTTDHPDNSVWQPGGTYKPFVLSERSGQIETTLLHGRWNGNTDPPSWSEPRIPRYLHYPVAADAELATESRGILNTAVYLGDLGDVLVRYVSVGVWTPAVAGGVL